MSLQQIKNLKEQKGFTIVELLIVIVVIGILAAIIIVAYTGVQNQARTTKSKSNASTIQKRLEAYYAEKDGTYPTVATWKTDSTAAPTAAGSIPANIKVVSGDPATKTDEVGLYYCATSSPTAANATGYKVVWWDYTKNAVTVDPIYGGDAKDGSTCAAA